MIIYDKFNRPLTADSRIYQSLTAVIFAAVL